MLEIDYEEDLKKNKLHVMKYEYEIDSSDIKNDIRL